LENHLIESLASTTSRDLAFYRSALLPCPYLPGRLERRFITELTPDLVEGGLFAAFMAAGFRRSHNYIYRPVCPSCKACVPVRIVIDRFQPRRTLKRTWDMNADLSASLVQPAATLEQFALFQRYQHSRHDDSEMAQMNFLDYRQLIEESVAETRLVELRDASGTLVGCCLFDLTEDGLSAVYSFFAADLPARSLGTYLVLWLIEHGRASGRRHVYLGYWVEDCRKMAYKVRFRPLEALGVDGWQPIDPLEEAAATSKPESVPA
jgi:arginyl-tRNA--protein-N-Asp/Glu arginylyltransferase